MSTPIAVAAINTLIQYGDGNCPETFSTVANVGDITGAMSTEHVDVTSHSSGVPWRQYFPTLHNPGAFTFPMFWVPNDPAFEFLLGIWNARTVGDWRLVFPAGAGGLVYSFTGFLTDWKPDMKVGDVIRATVGLQVTGEIFF